MWIFNKEEKTISLSDIECGYCFRYKEVLFIKTNEEDHNGNRLVVSLWSGDIQYLPLCTQVRSVKAVVITGKSAEEMRVIISERNDKI